jgi:RNA polymerase sigma factor (sigma-70 family)
MEIVHGLLENVRKGDESSFDRLVGLYESSIDAILPRYLDKAQFSDDLRQQGLVALTDVIRRTAEFHSEDSEEIVEYDKNMTSRIISAVRYSLDHYTESDPDIDPELYEKIRLSEQERKQAREEYYKLLGRQQFGDMDSATKQRLNDLYHQWNYALTGYNMDDRIIAQTGLDTTMSMPPLSIDNEEVVSIPADNDTAEQALRQVLKSEINSILAKLPEKERQVFELRFGLNGNQEHTLEALGKIFGVQRERIRQIEITALAHIRKLKQVRDSWEYLRD